MENSPRGWRTARVAFVVFTVLASALVASRSSALTPTYDLNGAWSVLLKDVACEGTNQGPYPMNVTGFTKSTGDFDWSFHSGASTGTGVESGGTVTFNSFGGAGSPDLNATASMVDGVLTLTSVVGTCQNNGGVNEWVFTYGGGLVVNSTKDTVDATEAHDGVCNVDPNASPPVCTLAQALAVSNAQGGDTIRFDILHKDGNVFDGSVPEIDVPINRVLEVNAPTTIDATSQPGGRVELSGFARNTQDQTMTRGIYVAIGGAGSTIVGMVINGFNDQLQLVGGNDTVQGDWFMTDAKGTEPDWNPNVASSVEGEYAQIGVDLESSGNQIGGSAQGEGNVFALSWSTTPGANTQTRLAGALYDGGQSLGPNTIQGNDIGVKPGTDEQFITPGPTSMPSDFDPEPGLDLSGSQNVGGPDTADGNRVANAIISGASTVQGNSFYGHVSVTGAANIGGPVAVPGTGPGNTFQPLLHSKVIVEELTDANTKAVIQGNVFKDPEDLTVAAGVAVDAAGATVGGPVANDANLFTGLDTRHGAIWIYSSHDVVQYDTITKSSRAGVQVETGLGNRITQVSMSGNYYGIELGDNGFLFNPATYQRASGPNDAELYPQVQANQTSASGTNVTGLVQQPGTLILDLYGQASCTASGYSFGQGAAFVGTQTVSSTFGNYNFDLDYPPLPAGMEAITMTATGSDGSTSAFSPCLALNTKAPSLLGAGVRPTSTSVPVSPGAVTASVSARLEGERTAGRGAHATIELLCPGGAQSPCTGTAVVVVPGTKYHNATLARTSFSMSAGTVSPVTVVLSKGLYASLRKAHRIATRLTTTASDASGAHVTKTFTVSLVT